MAEGHAGGPQRLVVALVRGVHGLRGAVRVEVLTDRPEQRFRPGTALYREGSDTALTIASAAAVQDGPGWRLRFDEVTTRDGADTLRGAYLETEVRPEAELGRGEVYWHEVVGVPVTGLDGTVLGTIRDVYRVAENEVYVVSGGPYGSFDLPAVRAFIRIFAPRRGEIVVDAEALDLQAPKVRPTGEDRPRAPRRTGPKRKTAAPTPADEGSVPESGVTAAVEDAHAPEPGSTASTASSEPTGRPPDAS